MATSVIVHDADLAESCLVWTGRERNAEWQRANGRDVTQHEIVAAQRRVTCYSCRAARRRRAGAHRKRPDLPLVSGACQLCQSPLPPRRRSWCSDACGQIWMGASNGTIMLAHLIELHGRECWTCGARWQPGRAQTWRSELGPPLPVPVMLEVDHIRALWSLTDEERSQPRWWLPFNIQLLCPTCHKAKTAGEAAARAAARRNAALEAGEQTTLIPT